MSAGGKQPAATEGKRKLTPFGDALKDLRARSGLSQVALARMAEVSTGYIGLIETGSRGNRPSLDVVKRLAQALNANLDETERLMKAAGWLHPDETLLNVERPDTRSVIQADRYLDDEQKRILIGVYDNMTRHTTAR
jgi:transcriptional regulator with XRE-family HTH domain